jgi:capsular polysaccharide export protein
MTILIHIDWNRRLPFYRRLAHALRALGHDVVFLSSSMAAWAALQWQGETVTLCRFGRASDNYIPQLDNTIEAAALHWTQAQCARLYAGTMAALARVHDCRPIEGLLIWNGGSVIGQAFKDFAAKRGIWIGFLEIANIAGKLFVDSQGVNARARIATEPDILMHYPVSEKAFETWKQTFLAHKRNAHVVPQSMDRQRFNFGATLDLIGVLAGTPWTRTETMTAKARRILLRQGPVSAILPENRFDMTATDYLFLPLQLSTDTNVMLNSAVDNESALQRAAAQAQDMGCKLVVKLHPAEVDPAFVRRVGRLQSALGFLVTRANTFTLMEHARLVATINSTAGIEARLLGCPIAIYGSALYANFTDDHLRNYIMGWLLDIDINNQMEIAPEQAAMLLKRCAV